MKILILLLFLVFLQIGCKKDALTRETQSGKNTFSCKINGDVFKPCPMVFDEWNTKSLYAYFSNNFRSLVIGASCTDKYPYQYVYLDLDNYHGPGEYLLSDPDNSALYIKSNPEGNYYESRLTLNGKVTISKDDRSNFILSGTFEFSAANVKNRADVVSISNGRFDIKSD